MSTEMSVAIGYVHGELVHHRFIESRDGAMAYSDAILIHEGSGPNVAAARNTIVRRFLDSDREWLYMCDTDTMFRSDAISSMLRRNKKIISALIYVAGEMPFPMMYKRIQDDSDGAVMFHVDQEWIQGVWPRGKCLRVDAVGAGCLLVHRDVYLEIEKRLSNPAATWFQETVTGNFIVGEDITFCMRAAQCGFDIYVDTAVRVGHMKWRVI